MESRAYRWSRWTALALGLGAAAAAVAQPTETAALTVEVRAEGRPVPGAVVRARSEQAVTNEAGDVTFRIAEGECSLTIEAAGFVPAVAEASVKAGASVRVSVVDQATSTAP